MSVVYRIIVTLGLLSMAYSAWAGMEHYESQVTRWCIVVVLCCDAVESFCKLFRP